MLRLSQLPTGANERHAAHEPSGSGCGHVQQPCVGGGGGSAGGAGGGAGGAGDAGGEAGGGGGGKGHHP